MRCHYFLIMTVIEISVNIDQSQNFGITIRTFFYLNFLKQARGMSVLIYDSKYKRNFISIAGIHCNMQELKRNII